MTEIMFHHLIFFLSLYQLSTITVSEAIDSSRLSLNELNTDDYSPKTQTELSTDISSYPLAKTSSDESEIDLTDPNTLVNIDFVNNAIVIQFKKQRRKQQALNDNFMRFGKRAMESFPAHQALDPLEPETRFERSNGPEGVRDSRGDSFMRFGRSGTEANNFMRFGRASSDFMRFGRTPSDFMRFGRSPSDFMRFGRSPSDFMRFGRSPSDFMRFGRSPSDFMRFGRSPSDFMRFGRTPSDFMRFGRSPTNFLRLGRASSQNFMRLGRSSSEKDKNKSTFMRFGRPENFMRFGRASTTSNVPASNPNFMRFGKRQKEDNIKTSAEQNHTEKLNESSTISPYQELDNDMEPLDMMFLDDISPDEN